MIIIPYIVWGLCGGEGVEVETRGSLIRDVIYCTEDRGQRSTVRGQRTNLCDRAVTVTWLGESNAVYEVFEYEVRWNQWTRLGWVTNGTWECGVRSARDGAWVRDCGVRRLYWNTERGVGVEEGCYKVEKSS